MPRLIALLLSSTPALLPRLCGLRVARRCPRAAPPSSASSVFLLGRQLLGFPPALRLVCSRLFLNLLALGSFLPLLLLNSSCGLHRSLLDGFGGLPLLLLMWPLKRQIGLRVKQASTPLHTEANHVCIFHDRRWQLAWAPRRQHLLLQRPGLPLGFGWHSQAGSRRARRGGRGLNDEDFPSAHELLTCRGRIMPLADSPRQVECLSNLRIACECVQIDDGGGGSGARASLRPCRLIAVPTKVTAARGFSGARVSCRVGWCGRNEAG